jgi:hypothetical protein
MGGATADALPPPVTMTVACEQVGFEDRIVGQAAPSS